MSSMIVPPYQFAVAHISRNSSSVPNAGSIWVLIRSKWPSTLGVYSQPQMPPARLTGPVCTPSMPISANAVHSLLVAHRGQERLARAW